MTHEQASATHNSRMGRIIGDAAAPGVLLLAIQGFFLSLFLNPALLKLLVPGLMVPYPRRMLVVTVVHVIGMSIFAFLIWRWRAMGRSALARLVFVRVPVLGGIVISMGTLFVVLSAQELLFFTLNALHELREPKRHVDAVVEGEIMSTDSLLGYRGIPCAVRRKYARLQPADTFLFDTVCHLDASGFRIVPLVEGVKSMHLATFGCSFMFGDGVNDSETLPAQLACLRAGVGVYNFAMLGYSPTQVPLLLETGTIDHLAERDGAAVYLLIPDHINRIVAARHRTVERTKAIPAFRLDALGEPRYLGALQDVYPVRIALNETMISLNAARWMELDSIVLPRKEHVELCVALLDLARREYQHRYPENEFYVLLDPSCHDGEFYVAALCEYMDARKLPWLDPGRLYGASPTGRFYFEGDGHPTPEAHARMAVWFWEQFPDGLLAGPRVQPD